MYWNGTVHYAVVIELVVFINLWRTKLIRIVRDMELRVIWLTLIKNLDGPGNSS